MAVLSAPLGVAVVGFGWMGRVHTQAFLRVRHHYPDLPVVPRLVTVVDEAPGRTGAAVDQFGFARTARGWQEVAADPEVAAVSVTAPNFLHREIAVGLARAGKHVWVEKPVGLTSADAAAVADAVAEAGVRSAVGFNYRYAPAVAHARELVRGGEIGRVTSARVRFLSDYAAHPEGALSWRFERQRGGNGVLGDLASHGVDLVRHLLGEVTGVVADTATYLTERARPTGATAGHARSTGGEMGTVENEDAVAALLRLESGARVVLEASRVAVGEQNNYGFEVRGTAGMVSWDFRRMGELRVSSGGLYQDQPVATVHVGPGIGEYAAFQPGAGIAMGYDDLKVVEAALFLRSIVEGRPHGAEVTDAVRAASVLDAMAASAASGAWVTPA